MPFRYKISNSAETYAFTPDALSADKLTDDAKLGLKPQEVGALFMQALTKLPKTRARLVWECTMDVAPPATIRPRKPKVWLTCTSTFEAGKVYVVG